MAQWGFEAHRSCLFTWAHTGVENRDGEHGDSQGPLTDAGLMKPPGASQSCVEHIGQSLPLCFITTTEKSLSGDFKTEVHGLGGRQYYHIKHEYVTYTEIKLEIRQVNTANSQIYLY